MPNIKINDYEIGPGNPTFLIAEVSQSHDGSLGMAHAFIDAAAKAGADAIKFQTHIANAESTLEEPFRVSFSRQDETRYEYWLRMEFKPDQWAGLVQHAEDKNLVFLSSAFSREAVALLTNLGIPAWKVGSGELLTPDLLDAMLAAGGPILLSTGMSDWNEIDRIIASMSERHASYAVFQCTSMYPTPIEDVGLNVLLEMRHRYQCPIGLSDHSGTPYPALAAMARGCDLLELHVTFDRRLFGPDIPASVTFDELALIRKARDSFVSMDQNPVDKDAMAARLREMRSTFGKSLALTHDLPAGTELTREWLTLKKPATGISVDHINEVIGRRLIRDGRAAHLLTWEDIGS